MKSNWPLVRLALAACVVANFIFAAGAEAQSSKPNIVVIWGDDIGRDNLSVFTMGMMGYRTPNIDRIGTEGARLNHCYVTNSICTPSRAAILTGTYNHVNGVTSLSTGFNNRMPHVAKHLQYAGYQTAIVGKWHLHEGPEHCPTGFDYWSVLPGQGEYFNPDMIENGERIVEEGYTTDIITDKCIDWIKERDKERPFFMMCHHKAPHRSWEYHPKYDDHYTDEIPYPDSFDDDYSNRAKAALHARIGRLVFGASDPKLGATGQLERLRDDGALFNHQFEAEGGVLAAEAGGLLLDFFHRRRETSPVAEPSVSGEVPKWS